MVNLNTADAQWFDGSRSALCYREYRQLHSLLSALGASTESQCGYPSSSHQFRHLIPALYTVPLPRLALNGILIYSSAEVVSDIIITSCLFYGLMKSKSGWAHTDRLVKRLMRLMLETQTPPAAT